MKKIGKSDQPMSEEELEKKEKLAKKMVCETSALTWRFEYNRTENPLFLMHAYKEYRDYEVPLPDWITEYFDRAVNRLLKTAERRRKGATMKKRAPVFVHDAFEMALNNRDVFNDYAKCWNHYIRFEEIIFQLNDEYPELMEPGQRNKRINMAVNIFNEKLPESEWITFDAADKWLERSTQK